MAEPINLNRARKAKARADGHDMAAANRAKFGRSKADKALDEARARKANATLDGAKRGD